MKKIVGSVSTRIRGSKCEFELEIEDGHTEEEIEEMALDAVLEEIDWSYNVEDIEDVE